MARLAGAPRRPIAIQDSEDEYSSTTTTKTSSLTTKATRSRTSPRKKAQNSYAEFNIYDEEDSESDSPSKLVIKAPTESARSKRQIKLAPLKASESSSDLKQKIPSPERSRRRPLKNVTGNRRASSRPRLNAFSGAPSLRPPVMASDEQEEEEAEVEESVWCGSDADSGNSDDELPSPRKLWRGTGRSLSAQRPKPASNSLDEALRVFQGLSIEETKSTSEDSEKPKQSLPDERPSSSYDKENFDAVLRFSPPRLATRPRAQTPERPVTPPPASPSKSRLVSPSKTKPRIPTPPHKESLDNFWNASTVNEWHDQHSPDKPLQSPKKSLFNRDISNQESTTPASSPKKSASSSPTKRTAAETKAKKDFSARKHALAESFLAELDQTITAGQIAALSASTGGVRLVWSKTLNSTAGRANWRRETIKSRCATTSTSSSSSSEPTAPPSITHKHHASIELAEKVIDDESRLLNVLAHEFCHLANFMVSGIKDQPHGTSFKAWGAKCTAAFGASRGVRVTTKHSYAIDYKYVWRCEGEACGAEFKRHSKSIDPKRHTCGSCRGRLEQVRPVPRGGVVGAGGAVGGYAGFVKKHFAEVRRGLPAGCSQKEVMEAVGRKYREEKERGLLGEKKGSGGASAGGVEEIANALDVVVLDD